MSAATTINRRDLLKRGAALVLGFHLPRSLRALQPTPAASDTFRPNAWIRITPDNRITVLVERPEMGQGPRTVDAMMLAEELEADWSTIHVEQAPTLPGIYKNLSAGGSGGVMSDWLPIRTVGAQAREMLLTAAARQLGVDRSECRAENSTVLHLPTRRRLTYGQLVDTASRLPVPPLEGLPLKNPSNFRLIGKPLPRIDTPSKIDGSAQFGIDVRVPGMLFAVIARCPHFGGSLATVDATAAKTVPGVEAVFPVAPIGVFAPGKHNIRVAGGVAVVATSTWAALQGRRALTLTWDKGPGATESTATIREQMQQQSLAPATHVAASRGDAVGALAAATNLSRPQRPAVPAAPLPQSNKTVIPTEAQRSGGTCSSPTPTTNPPDDQRESQREAQGPGRPVPDQRESRSEAQGPGQPVPIEATYELPFQAHATMEPMNTTVHVRNDGIEVWSPTQIAAETQSEIALLAGIPPEHVTVHMTFCGGSFGRRYQWDYAAEAWQVANQVRKPVQLVWTREDDMQHDFYRQYNFHRMSAALDAHGTLLAWKHRIVSTPIRAVFDSPESLRDPKHVAAQEISCADTLPYAVPNFLVDYAPVDSVVPRAWWRGVESSFNAFATECFIDEVSHAAGEDPCAFRIRLLEPQLSAAPHPEATPSNAPKAKVSAAKESASPTTAANHRKFQAVLRLARDKSGWGTPLPARHGRGIACYSFANSYIAMVAEVSVAHDGSVTVQRVVTAIDCGIAINPDGVRAMAEGGINYALTPVLSGEITVRDGAVVESNFHDYQVLRIEQAPTVEVHLVPSTDPPTGMGEAAVPPLAPAVANAVFAATGKRLRRLPIDPAQLAVT